MHLSTKSTWHHHTVPFHSLKSCKISWGSCQHNATSAFTAVGSIYHYLHCKHFDITLTQTAFFSNSRYVVYLVPAERKEQSEYLIRFQITSFGTNIHISGLKTCFRINWRSPSAQSRTLIHNTKDYQNQCWFTVEDSNVKIK